MESANLILISLFEKVLRLSTMASIIFFSILLIRYLTKDKAPIRFHYMLWFILIIRLLLPAAPASRFSIYNFTPALNQSSYVQVHTDIDSNFKSKSEDKAAEPKVYEINRKNNIFQANILQTALYSLKILLPKLWVAGVGAGFIIVMITYAKFFYSVRKEKPVMDNEIINLLNQCKEIVRVSKHICLIETDLIKTPALFGFFNPKILVPKGLLKSANHKYLRYVFLHELAHIKRNDIITNFITTALSIIYWFNPIIWYAFNKMSGDREVCCDCLALTFINEDEVYNYGLTIIKLSEENSKTPWLPGVAGIINSKSKIKRRIGVIKEYKKSSYKLSAAAIAAFLIVSSMFLTNSKAEAVDALHSSAAYSKRIVDKIDYPFINDEAVVGKWECVDFVYNIEDFKAGVQKLDGVLYLKGMTILEKGKMSEPITTDTKTNKKTVVKWLTWTKGYILHHGDKTASEYIVKEIDGVQYLFYEFKNGDYALRGMRPFYYVLEKVSE